MGKITAIYIKERAHNWKECKEIILNKSKEDPKNLREISFITSIGYNKLFNDPVKGFCHSRYKPNFVINQLPTEDLREKDRLIVGEAIIEITIVGKSCHAGCPALQSPPLCQLNKYIFFGKVIETGKVKCNDRVDLM